MSLTKFPKGVQTSHIVSAETIKSTGKVFFVCNSTTPRPGGVIGADVAGLGQDPTRPFATLDFAIGQCVDNRGDTIFILEGHAETVSSASAITVDVAGISIIGLGTGNVGSARPIFTFSTSTAASIAVTANNVKIENIIGVAGINGLTSPFNISGNGHDINIEWSDNSSSVEAQSAIVASTNKTKIKLAYFGNTSGSSCATPIKLNSCGGVYIDVFFYGKASTAVVNFVTTASSDVNVYGYMYNSGTTNGSKLVVDTIGGSTWYAEIQDGAAGAKYSGGSGAALAADDVSSISSALLVPTADVTTNTNERDVIGNKTDAAVTTVGTTKSIVAYSKGLVQTLLSGAAADGSGNSSLVDVVGNKTDASIYVPGTTKSLAAYAKGTADLQERVALSSTSVMVNGNTIFTIAGGPIQILALVSECVTANDGTASTIQYSVTPTTGSAQTISAASASIANAAAGASITLAGTALSTAALYNANGPNLIANPGTIYAPAGIITIVVAVGSTTGTWRHRIRYKPLAVGVTVS